MRRMHFDWKDTTHGYQPQLVLYGNNYVITSAPLWTVLHPNYLTQQSEDDRRRLAESNLNICNIRLYQSTVQCSVEVKSIYIT